MNTRLIKFSFGLVFDWLIFWIFLKKIFNIWNFPYIFHYDFSNVSWHASNIFKI